MTRRAAVLIRCDAFPAMGFGHVVRSLALADRLGALSGEPIAFAVSGGTAGAEMVKAAGHPTFEFDGRYEPNAEMAWLRTLLGTTGARRLVLDVPNNLSRADVEQLRAGGPAVIVVDDPSERRLAADAAFFPPIPQVREWDWTGFDGELFVGWEWIVLRSQFANLSRAARSGVPRVLVTMGGSDPHGFTPRVVCALRQLSDPFEALVVVGPGFQHREALDRALEGARERFHVRENVPDMAATMLGADVAVGSFGVTAYELAAAGVPAVYVCLSLEHARSASALVDEGAAMSFGVHTSLRWDQIAGAVTALLGDPEGRARMSARAQALVDGRGASRVAAYILRK